MPEPTRHLLVMPDDGPKALLDAIENAKHSLVVKMFVFSDPPLLEAVIGAHKRGVQTRVMLNRARRSGESDNSETQRRLLRAGVPVKDSNPAFDVSHEKSMVVDGRTAFIKSLNWEPKNFSETRDYAIVTTDPDEVTEVAYVFDADWNRLPYTCPPSARLIWCRGNARERMTRFIDEATHSLRVQNERYQDVTIIEHLIRAKERGVKVKVMARPPHTLKEHKLLEGVGGLRMMQDVGIKVHKLKGLQLHAKMMVADHKRAIVGSMNLAPGSFEDRRELGIQVHEPDIVSRLEATFDRDWENSHKLDLSDEAVREDMERHGRTDFEIAELAPEADPQVAEGHFGPARERKIAGKKAAKVDAKAKARPKKRKT